MRTSSQLTSTHQCIKNPQANITTVSDSMLRASAQKEVILRILKGEPISDIGEEISNILFSKNCLWENTEQRRLNLDLYKARINRYLHYEQQREHIFPDDFDKTVDFFGEPIEARPDFFVREGNTIRVCKVKTSRYGTEADDSQNYETYCLGLLGEKLFPDKEIIVEILHLADKTAASEKNALLQDYDNRRQQKMTSLIFSDAVKNFFADKYNMEREEGSQCSKEECASCSMNNICNYEEPPIPGDVENAVKPISDIRLTMDQQAIIDYDQGIARVNAGAGAGKTLVVAMRIVELLKKGYEPEDICLLTFTNAGAEEMTARVVNYCAESGLLIDPARLTSTTFNAFCQEIIKEYYEELGYSRPPRVIPDETRSGIINRLLSQFPHIDHDDWKYSASSTINKYSKFAKSAFKTATQMFAEIKKEDYTRWNNPYMGRYTSAQLDIIFQMYERYKAELFNRDLLEFDDQIKEVFRLLEIHPTLFEEKGYRHIIVDEFQDTDLPQINLLNKIRDTASFLSFMAVGDDSQSIFAFRHTSPEFMINFGNYFGNFHDFRLVDNHRSNAATIHFANTVNALAKNRVIKDLIPTKPEGITPEMKGFYSQEDEYRWIAEQIKEKIDSGIVPADMAFIASDRTELTKMASILTEYGIPSVLMNPIPYVENSRVAALTTFYDSFVSGSTQGLLDYQNVITHGSLRDASATVLEELSLEFTQELHAEEKTVGKFLEYAKALDIEEQDECYQSFLEKVEFCQDMEELEEFMRDFKLYGSESKFKREGRYAGVCITTVHSAKGLEWDTTYVSLSKFDKENYHTNSRSYEESGEQDENFRKWFVGATRARKELIMTGQFVLAKKKNNELIYNQFVQKAYHLLGKTWDFSLYAYSDKCREEKLRIQRAKLEEQDGIASIFYKRTATIKPDIEPTGRIMGQKNPFVRSGQEVLEMYRGRMPGAKVNIPNNPQNGTDRDDPEDTEIEFA